MQTFPLTIKKKEVVAHDLLLVQFQRPYSLSFVAGQHLTFYIPTHTGMTTRKFSIASSPFDDHIEILVRLVDHGVASLFFADAKEGSSVETQAPSGTFSLHPQTLHAHFIASGSGISPLRSMIKYLLHNHPETKINLTCGGDIGTLQAEFSDLHAHKRLVFTTTLSDSVTQEADTNRHYYICGSPNFVSGMETGLLEAGIKRDSIFYESY